uniref:DNA polymerase zeta catalytic subunit n=1 Tax=Callorhinchus milii TaxID=7868 RepID=A0A4W3J521_CALMI
MFAVRIVSADYYMSSPVKGLDVCFSEFRENEVKRVPVVRIFGSTPAGQRSCLHLHGMFPYLYVPYNGYGQEPEQHLRQMAFSIDRALNVALGNPSSNVQHVFRVSLVSGIPFYGYHEKERHFMKIYLYNPLMVKRYICELLQGGAVMNKSYQPYEAHLPYLLQLFIDYNLYGMNLIHLAAVKFRKTKRKGEEASQTENSINCSFVWWEEEDIPSSLILEGVDRQSTCELELDAVAADILNRLEVEAQIGKNPGLQAIWEDEKQRCRENNKSSQIELPPSQDRDFVQITESEKIFQRRIREVLQRNNYSVALSQSMDESEEFNVLSSNLTLHMDELSPEAIPCTPACLVEIHSDKEQGKTTNNPYAKFEDAIVDEEAILSVMENSQTFHPLSQRLIQSPILNTSQDQAMVHLLAGLEEDGYEVERSPFASGGSLQQHSIGNYSYQQNSDNEENEPEIQKEELELSLIMSQRWDGEFTDKKNISDCSSEEDYVFSDDEMVWRGNRNMLANLSIPQLDGAADENSDNAVNEKDSRTHSTLAVQDKILAKTTFHKEAVILQSSSAQVGLQCNHTGTIHNTVNDFDSTGSLSYQNSFITEMIPEHSASKFSNEATGDLKCNTPSEDFDICNAKLVDATVVDKSSDTVCERNCIISGCEKQLSLHTDRLQKVKKYISIDKNLPIQQTDLTSDEFYNNSIISSLDGRKANNMLPTFSKKENCICEMCVENNVEKSLNELKIRYEDFHATRREKTIIDQHEAQYTFFPSVVLPNCLKCPEKVFSKSCKLKKQDDRRLKLKLSRKKSNTTLKTIAKSGTAKMRNVISTEINTCSKELLNNVSVDHNSVPVDVACTSDAGVKGIISETEIFSMEESPENGQEGQSFRLACSKYTLRTKRKVSYETEDCEPGQGSEILKASPTESECSKAKEKEMDNSQRSRKRRRLNKKEPPVIIKYIIINRFKGRKNMLVKIGKLDSNEDQVMLDNDKLEKYQKLSPLKDWWPKVTDPPVAIKPLVTPTPKKGKRAKVQSTLKKRTGKLKKTQKKEKRIIANKSQVKRSEVSTRKMEFATLSPPSPCYSAEADDCLLEYKDVMSKLGFMSERATSPCKHSPPRCWSPSEIQDEEMAPMVSLEEDVVVRDWDSDDLNNSGGKDSIQGNGKPEKKWQLKSRKKSSCNSSTTAKKKKISHKTKQVTDGGLNKPKEQPPKKTRKRKKMKRQNGSSQYVNDEFHFSKEPPKSKFHADFDGSFVAESEAVSKAGEQPDIPLSVYSTGHLPSTQPYSEEFQGDSGGYYRSLLETDNHTDLPGFSFPPDEQVSETLSQSRTTYSHSTPHFSLNKANPSCVQSDTIYMLSEVLSPAQLVNSQQPFEIKRMQNVKDVSLRESVQKSSLFQSEGEIDSKKNSSSQTIQQSKVDQEPNPNSLRLASEESRHSMCLPINNVTCSTTESSKVGNEKDGRCLDPATCGHSKPLGKKVWGKVQETRNILDISDFTPQRIKQRSLSETFLGASVSQTQKSEQIVRTDSQAPVSNGPSSLAVLRELLHKRQQKAQEANVQTSTLKPQFNRSTSYPTEKTTKNSRTVKIMQKKPKAQKCELPKCESTRKSQTAQSKCPFSDDSPVFHSDPGFDSCYSFDSLSPELPQSYNFDINTVGQTRYCTIYSGCQFMPAAEQNLPQKFLSDIQESVPAQAVLAETNVRKCQTSETQQPDQTHQPLDNTEWVRSGSISPDLFEKSPFNNGEKLKLSNKNSNLAFSNALSSSYECSNIHLSSLSTMDLKDHAQNQCNSFLDSDASCSPAKSTTSQTTLIDEGNGRDCLSVHSAGSSPKAVVAFPGDDSAAAGCEDQELCILKYGNSSPATSNSSPSSVNSPSQTKNNCYINRTSGAHVLKPLMSPPSREEIVATLLDHNLAEAIYQEPFCSDPSDAPEKPREIGGRFLTVETRLPNELPEFDGDFSLEGLQFWKTALSAMTQNVRPGSPAFNGNGHYAAQGSERIGTGAPEDRKIIILPCRSAPSVQRVHLWLQAKREYERSKKCSKNQVELTEHIKQIQPTHLSQAGDCTFGETQLPKAAGADDDDDDNDDDEEEEEDYHAYSSPDSPMLPPWQQPSSPDPRQCEPNEENVEVTDAKQCQGTESTLQVGVAPTCSSEPQGSRPGDEQQLLKSPLQSRLRSAGNSASIVHSTPIAQRKSDGIPEALYSFTTLEPRLQKMSQRKASNSDTLRRVLLTTQLKNQFAAHSSVKKDTSQIEGATLNNSYGFKISQQNLKDAKALHEVQYLVLMSMELHARTRRDLKPDPEFDPICALFYCISSDALLPGSDKTEVIGALLVDKDHIDFRSQAPLLVRSGVTGLEVTYVNDEKELFQELLNLIRRYDPDILLGYEVQMHSWGYLLQRAAVLEVHLCQMISRIPDDVTENRFSPEKDEYGADTMTEINIVGRIVLNIWRMMRSEIALNNYSFQNVAFHMLHQRFPLFAFRTLSDWFDKTNLYRWKMVDHYICRVRGNLLLLEQQDIIGRTSELARLFGILFYHVLTRGSQFRVESMMLRIAKPMNYIAISPSVQQRAQMRAPQCVPLVMEPESRFYSNSVLVLDFQSLYPSIVIAYNYCYSTCLGNIDYLGKHEEFKFGSTSLRVPPELLHQLWNNITVSPNGVAFVKPSVRKGVLPNMLEEILKTRIMVKQAMKAYKKDKALTRLLDARQLGLKLIANVTFGYTAANFSGRMPCVEIGDSIVHKARETLERAIKLVNETKKWGARVVYGDTDSMFVLLKGATKEQAFKIGQEIADAVTATNPKPVKLKFEKVYLPCVLQTKKRYVGYMYESLDQKDPVFDAKGIETVRRDSCPAVSKILERSIKLLFETRDISQIKQYLQRQCMKVLEGKASMQDLTFAKEYRGSGAYRPGACVPALELTRRMLSYDRRSEPRVTERVPYVIVYGSPGLPLIQLVRRPVEVLQDPSLRLNATYYITKQILPPLNRIFSLIGVDVFSWYQELPRVQKAFSTARMDQDGRKGTISQYFTTLHCPVCDELTQLGICSKCRNHPQQVTVILNQEIREWESKHDQLLKICKNCTGCVDRQVQCVSLDCPVLYKLFSVSRELTKAPYLRQLLDQF